MAVAEQTLPMPVKKAQVSQSYWSLVWWKFKRNRVALVGGVAAPPGPPVPRSVRQMTFPLSGSIAQTVPDF